VIVRRYVETVVATRPATLQRTLGLPSEPVNAALEVLMARRILTKQGDWILRNVQ
jgi:hypothetical protein